MKKENEIIFLENNEKVKYRVVLKIEGTNKTYIVYTKDEKTLKKETILYVGEFINNNDGSVRIISIKEDKEWKYIRNIINSLGVEEKNGE